LYSPDHFGYCDDYAQTDCCAGKAREKWALLEQADYKKQHQNADRQLADPNG